MFGHRFDSGRLHYRATLDFKVVLFFALELLSTVDISKSTVYFASSTFIFPKFWSLPRKIEE